MALKDFNIFGSLFSNENNTKKKLSKNKRRRRQFLAPHSKLRGIEGLEARRLLATVTFDLANNTLIYEHDGDGNDVTYTFNDRNATQEFVFENGGNITTADAICSGSGTSTVTCASPDVAQVRIDVVDTAVINASRIGDGNAGAENIAIGQIAADTDRITGFSPGVPVEVMNAESIRLAGIGSDDSLSVLLPAGVDNVTVKESGTDTDGVFFGDPASTEPRYEFTGMNNITIDAAAGAGSGDDNITFVTGSLAGSTENLYSVVTDAGDTLIIDGNDGGNDVFHVSDPDQGGPQSVQVTDAGSNVRVTAVSPTLGLLQIKGGDTAGGGDDVLNVDVTNLRVNIEFDAGTGSDAVNVFGSGVETVTHVPGSSTLDGTIDWDGTTLTYKGLEPVVDTIAATNMIVTDVGGAPTITYSQVNGRGFIDPDTFETIEFDNKRNLIINAEGGNDQITISTSAGLSADGSITVNGAAGADEVTIEGTAGADNVVVDHLTANSARISGAQAVPITVNTVEDMNIDGLGGDDSLTVHGTAAGEAVDINTATANTVTIGSLLPVEYTMFEAINAVGGDGDDTFTVTPHATIPVFVDGGNPIALPPGDTLVVKTTTSAVLMAGPQVDEGSLVIDGQAPVSFDRIESVMIMEAMPGQNNLSVIVMGTGGDDQITVTGQGSNSIDVQINNGAVMSFTGVNELTIQGKHGDDQIDIDLVANLGVTINVDGGLPSVSGDSLTVTGTDAADSASWAPSGPDSGTLVAVGTTINVTTIEDLTYDGRDGGDTLSIAGTPLDDSYAYQPAGTGTGSMTSDGAPAFTFLGVDDLAVTGGAGGFDSLAITTTDAADFVTSDNDTVMLADGGNATVGAGMDRVELYTLGGDDIVDLDLQLAGVQKFVDAGAGDDLVDLSDAFDAEIHGGSGDDILIGSPFADTIFGGDGNDTIIGGDGNDYLDGGRGQDSIRGDGGSDNIFGGDDSDEIIWNDGDGSDTVEGGQGNDLLIVNGDTAAGDAFVLRPFLSPPGTGPHIILERTNQTPFQLNTATVELFEVQGGGGADSLTVHDLFETDARTVFYVAGGGVDADSLTVEGRNTNDHLHLNNTAGILTVEGLTYDVTMAQGNASHGDTVTINGNDGDDTIEAGPGTDLLALLTFNGGAGDDTLLGSTGNDTLNGGTGNDVISGRGGIDTVDGGTGGNSLLATGTVGDNNIVVAMTGAGGLSTTVDGLNTTYQGPGGSPITNANLEQLQVIGLAGNDTLTVDEVNGLVPIAINYHGDEGDDLLIAINGVGVTATYFVGPTVDAGLLVHTAGGITQSIHFDGLEPVVDLSAGSLTVNANDADNAINYSTSEFNVFWGTISIDDFEPIHFANKTDVTINAGAGSDTINIDTPVGLSGEVIVDGGHPTASDTVIVTGTAGPDAVTIAQLTDDGAMVSGLATTVNVTAVEHLVYSGQGGNDSLTVTSPAFGSEIDFTPGATPDAGSIRHSRLSPSETALLPIDYVGLGDPGSLIFDVAGGGRFSGLDIHGTDADDQFDVSAAGDGEVRIVKPAFSAPVTAPITTPGIIFLRLIGHDGDDAFDIPGDHPILSGIEVQGGNPGSGSDELNFEGAGGAVAVDIEAQTVTESGQSPVIFTGIETIYVDTSSGAFTLAATSGDDTIVATPLTTTIAPFALNGTIQANGNAPVVHYEGVTTANIDGGGGKDTLIVNGSSAGSETIDVSDMAVTTPGGTITFNGAGEAIEALTVNGLQGDDTFNVTQGDIPIFIDGGDPIGGGDTIVLTPPSAPTFMGGPENDEGVFTAAGAEPVSFDHIESVTVDLDGGPMGGGMGANGIAIVMGTGDDDHITAVGTAPNTVEVQVNDGPVVTYINATSITLQGKNGDDDFDIDLNFDNLGVVFTVDGGLPNASDTLTVKGIDDDAPGTVNWTPATADSGILTLVNQTINVIETEHVIYDGETDGDTVQVLGSGTFTHTPGQAFDFGQMELRSGNQTMLGIAYENLGAGAVTAFGLGLSDTLVARGTAGPDTIDVVANSGTVQLTTGVGPHVPVNQILIEHLDVEALDDDDDITINAPQLYQTIHVLAGSPSGSDTVNFVFEDGADNAVRIAGDPANTDDQVVTGLGPATVHVTGAELVTFTGNESSGDLDVLVVELGVGNSDARVSNANSPNTDQVTSDSLPTIEFGDLETFELEAAQHTVATFVTTELSGSVAYQFDATTADSSTLAIEGGDGLDDNFTVTNPNAAAIDFDVAVADNNSGVTVCGFGMSAGTSQLRINSLGGGDRVTVDVDSRQLVEIPITFDGGDNSDSLTVEGTPLTTVMNVTYSPGPGVTEGRLEYDGTMLIDFIGLQPVLDTVPAMTLTVNGTNDSNVINYSNTVGGNGFVSVDAFETIEFSRKQILRINGGSGDDTVTLNGGGAMAPAGLARIDIFGDDSNGGDALLVNNDNIGSTINVHSLGTDSATIVGAQFVEVRADMVESIAIDGAGAADDLNITTPAVANTIIYTPGATVDSGEVIVDSLVPLSFENLGASGDLIFSNTGGGNPDTLVHRGSDTADTFTVDGLFPDLIQLTNSIGMHVTVFAPGVDILTLEGLAGADDFTIFGPHSFGTINVNGGSPDDGDSLALQIPTGTPRVNLGTSTITNFGGPIVYNGIQSINADAGGGAIELWGTAGDDEIIVTPLTDLTGVAQAGGQAPVVRYHNTGGATGATLLVDGRDGEDRLVVNATTENDRIEVNGPAAFVDTGADGGVVDFVNAAADAGIEALTVNGLEGDDNFDVTPALNLSIFIDGGDPIGIEGDSLNLNAVTSSTFRPGPENDEGGFDIDSTPTTSYDHIEGVTVTSIDAAGNPDTNLMATVCGTNGDDDITAQGVAGNMVDVTVNDGPVVRYAGVSALRLEGKNGDDDIDIDVQVENLNVEFTADGGSPGATGDVVTVTGVDNDSADNVNWTPGAATTDDGTLVVNGETIHIENTEDLIYDGEGDGDHLTVTGGGRFVHTPGGAVDAGHVALNSLLDIHYVNLGSTGSVVVDGTSGNDTLVSLASDGSDEIEITFTGDNDIDIDVSDAHGEHVDLRSNDVENYEIRSLAGDDVIRLGASFNVSGTFKVFAGDPGTGSDVFEFADATATAVGISPDAANSARQLISGIFTNHITLSGVEFIDYNGNSGETLTVDPGLGDNEVTVQRGNNTGHDQITADSLPLIEFGGVQTLLIDASSPGGDTVTFVTWFLTGAQAGNYQMSGGSTDALVIQGVNGGGLANDKYTVTNPVTGPVAVTDNGPATPVTVTAVNANLGRLVINTLGGDDEVTVNVNGTNLISTPITFDGGGNSDTLYLTGTPSVATAGTYSPGAAITEGRLRYVEQDPPAGVMTIDFLNLEPVIDDMAGTLTVNGTDANNAIDYRSGTGGRGTVSVDGFERIDFRNKTALTIDAKAGDDVVNLNNPTAPAGLAGGSITVIGGNSTTGDRVIVNGTAQTDNIGFTPTGIDQATVTGVQGVTSVLIETSELVVINGLDDTNADGDVLTINTRGGAFNSTVEITPGNTYDAGTVQVDTWLPMQFRNLSRFGVLNVQDPDPGAADADRLIYNGTDNDDAFVVPFSNPPQIPTGTPSLVAARFIGPFLQMNIPVISDDVEAYTIRGRAGSDSFNIAPLVGVDIRVEGGDPDAGSDALNFSAAAAAVDLILDDTTNPAEFAQIIRQAGFGDVTYTGIEELNLDANSQNLDVTTTANDDVVEVTPLGTNSGELQSRDAQGNSTSPVVRFTETGTFTLDTAAGENKLIVNGSSLGEVISASGTAVTIGSRETVNYTATAGGNNALTVNAREGSDTITVTPSSNVPIFVDGGDPIGVSGDRLIVEAENTSLFHPGPENDEGGFDIDMAQTVSFDRIEAVTVIDPGNGPNADNDLIATVCATNGNDEITAVGRAANTVDVTINDGPIVTYDGVAALILEGKNGDDEFDIDVQVANLGTEITVDGGLPAATGDEVTVSGIQDSDNPDTATWQPLYNPAADDIPRVGAGTLTIDNAASTPVTINVVNLESVIYDGESEDETLIVRGFDGFTGINEGRDRFVHIPGPAVDAGSVAISTQDESAISSEDSMLGISYVNLGHKGLIMIDGGGSLPGDLPGDTLVILGTDGDDVLNVNFRTADADPDLDLDSGRFDLRSAAGNHIDVISARVENYEIRMLEGDDDVHLQARIEASGTFAVHTGGPGGSDSVNFVHDDDLVEHVTVTPDTTHSDDQVVTGLSLNPIDLVGVELITFEGGNSLDKLTVDPGAGDNWVTVQRGQFADEVTSDSLPKIEFNGLDTFEVDGLGGGADVATFATWSLAGATNSKYEFSGSAIDTLVIEGVDGSRNGDDEFTVTNPAGTPAVAVTDNNGTNVTVTGTSSSLGRLQINTLGGDDLVLVNVTDPDLNDIESGLIFVPITFDGGGGSDMLRVEGDPGVTVQTVEYSPGPAVTEGRLTYNTNAPNNIDEQVIDFVNLEPVIDLVPANELIVNGTHSNNAINYSQGEMTTWGRVSVDNFEVLDFSKKDQLTINALAGNDVVNLNNDDLPTGNNNANLDVIKVNGGDSTVGDQVIVNGTGGGDAIVYHPLAPDAANITGVLASSLIELNTVESITINGEGGNDDLDINTPMNPNRITYSPGTTVDSGEVRVDSLVPVSFVNLGVGGTLNFTDPGGRVDTLIHRGSTVNDEFSVAAVSGDVTIANTPGVHIVATTAGINHLVMDALGGDDTINIAAQHPFLTIDVNGQEPSASDILNVTGTAGTDAITVTLKQDTLLDPRSGTIEGIGSVSGEIIRHTGIEHVNIGGGGGADDTLTVVGTTDDDNITYEPIGAQDGKFHNEGSNTSYVFRNIGGQFTIDGSDDGADDVTVLGTNDHDVITVDAPNRVVTVENANGIILKPVVLATTIEDLDVLARGGNDTIHVIPAPPLAETPIEKIPRNLIIDIDGGSPSASDALVIAGPADPMNPEAVARLDATHFVVVNHSRRYDEGTIRVYQDAPGTVQPPTRFPDIGFVNVEVVNAHVTDPAEHRLILGPDVYEQNDDQSDAKFIGTGKTLNITNLAIFPPIREHRFVIEDVDWFHFVAESTGTLDFQLYFREYSDQLLPQGGNIYAEVYDADGTLIAGNGNFGTNDEDGANVRDDNERIRIPAVAGQSYFLKVYGAPNPNPNPDPDVEAKSIVVNGYSVSVTNTVPTVPYDIELADIVAQSTVDTVETNPAPDTIEFIANGHASLNATDDDFYNGKWIYFLTGDLRVRRGEVLDYNAGTGRFIVDSTHFPPGTNVQTGDEFVVETHDTGRSQFDNVTRDETPVIRFRLDDGIFLHDLPGNAGDDSPPDEVIPIPFNTDQTRNTTTAGYRVPVFIEGPPQAASGPLPQVPVGYARMLAEGVYEFDFGRDAIDPNAPNGPTTSFALDANNGSYFLSARVEIDDPATPTQFGYGARSVSLEIVVDTIGPPVFFGDPIIADDGLMPGSDSGVIGQNATFADGVTNATYPEFWGIAEANTVVMLYVDMNGNMAIDGQDVFIGEGVAVPEDGTNQFPHGQWNIRSVVNLNDPTYGFTQDGVRSILAAAEDVAGNITLADKLHIFLDTHGPQVTAVYITDDPSTVRNESQYDLFDPKPSTDGPTPPVRSLSIDIRDLPARSDLDPDFLYDAVVEAIVETDGAIKLVGDHNGIIPIQEITWNSNPRADGELATGTIVLTFAEPLPDDRFTLTIFDRIVDPVGNRLDGESDTFEPEDSPTLPSGDWVPGGDFVARFTVDSRPEIATVCCGSVYVDTNGNLVWDPQGKDNDYTNTDMVFAFGLTSDAIFAGNFRPDGATSTSGFDKLGAYGFVNGAYRFLLQFDPTHQAAPVSFVSLVQVNGIPVAGNFDPSQPGDEIGLFDGRRWYLDSNGNNILGDAGDLVIDATNTEMRGLPIVGDFNGDGQDDLATHQSGTDKFFIANGLDVNNLTQINFGFTGITERPVAGDLNLDGIDDLGLWVPGRSGQLPKQAAEWYFLVSDSVGAPFDSFLEVTLGNDVFAQFGDEYALPVFGNFDPPTTGPDSPNPAHDTNPVNAYDVNADGMVSALDVIIAVNAYNNRDTASASSDAAAATFHAAPYLDVNGSGDFTPADILMVINEINSRTQTASAEGEAAAAAAAGDVVEVQALSSGGGSESAGVGGHSAFASGAAIAQTGDQKAATPLARSTGSLWESRQSSGARNDSTANVGQSPATATFVEEAIDLATADHLFAQMALVSRRNEDREEDHPESLTDLDEFLNEFSGDVDQVWQKR